MPSASGPPLPSTQYCAIEWASAPRPAATPAARKIQPIGLSGWRAAIRTPTAANTSAIAQMKSVTELEARSAGTDSTELDSISTSASAASPHARRNDGAIAHRLASGARSHSDTWAGCRVSLTTALQLGAERAEVDLVAQPRAEKRLERSLRVVLAPVEAPVDHLLDARAGRAEQRRDGERRAGDREVRALGERPLSASCSSSTLPR